MNGLNDTGTVRMSIPATGRKGMKGNNKKTLKKKKLRYLANLRCPPQLAVVLP